MATILIGIADLKIAKFPDDLTTLGLGSCVGITLYDKVARIGGLAHIMLPSSNNFAAQNRMKFADTAIVDLLDKMIRAGASRSKLVAKLAGGAHMFSGSGNNVLKVGERNAAASEQALRALGIMVQARDTGGSFGRTIVLSTGDGSLKIRLAGGGEKTI